MPCDGFERNIIQKISGDIRKDDAARFPEGMEQTVERIRKAGMLPGIWFEFEISGEDSELFEMTSWELHRNGFPVTAGKRNFLPSCFAYR